MPAEIEFELVRVRISPAENLPPQVPPFHAKIDERPVRMALYTHLHFTVYIPANMFHITHLAIGSGKHLFRGKGLSGEPPPHRILE